MTSKTLTLYAAGGFAVNIANRFNKARGRESLGFATLNTKYIDTSRSNIDASIEDQDIYLFDGLDGSGKLRKANYGVINERANEILHQFPPTDINIVVHSASGGSGSTIGPVLVSKLLERGETVIVVLVGSTSSRIETENSLKTLQSYEVIAQKRNKAVPVYYQENSPKLSRSDVDGRVHYTLVLLTVLFSGQNRELDQADLRNFLNYPDVTRFQPGLVGLDIFSGDVSLENGQALYSLATLIDAQSDSTPNHIVEYQTVGYVPEGLLEDINVKFPIHYATLGNAFAHVVKSLQEKLSASDAQHKATVVKSIVTSSEGATDDGLIL